jgi:hypothetical protein
MAFIYDLTDTWNAGGTTFNAIRMNVTDTASAAESRLISLQVGGAERFGVDKAGVGLFSGAIRGPLGTGGAPAFSFTGDTNTGMWSPAADTLAFSTNGAERARITSAGNLGVGTVSPAARLDVAGSVRFGTNFQWDNANNRLGIGTTTPSTALNVVSSSAFSFATILESTSNETALANLPVMTLVNNGTGNNNGGGIRFRAADTDGTVRTAAQVGFIASGKTASSIDGSLYFATGLTERMRITDTGNVGIGTTSPNAAARLDVTSTTSGFLPPRMTTTQRDAITSPPNGLILYNSTTNKLQVRAGGAWVDLH